MFLVALALLLLNVYRIKCLDRDERTETADVVPIETAPYAVIVLCNNSKYFCSGTILHPEWVLTSAHCLYNLDGTFTEDDNSITVIAGTGGMNDVNADVKAGKAQIRKSKQLLVQYDYSWLQNFIHDLVLINLSEPLSLTSRVAVAPDIANTEYALPSNHPGVSVHRGTTSSMQCYGFGFGKLKRKEESEEHDYFLKKQIYDVGKHCHCLEKARSKDSPHNVLKKRNIFICDELCSHIGFCEGDNGGQLICDGKLRGIATTLLHVQDLKTCVPLTKHKHQCGDCNTVEIFTDLCYFSVWLGEIIPKFNKTDENCNPVNYTTDPKLDHL